MARQQINIGLTANDGTGDPLRTAFDKINDNFIELYGADNDINTLDANLDVNNFAITTGVTNGDITVTPNGTGNINLGSVTINGSTISANDSTQITIAENVQTTGTLNVTGATTIGGAATLSTSLALASGATVTAILDEDVMGSNSATALATQQSIKAYVDSQVTAQDLDFATDDSTALSIDLDSESLQFSGGNGINTSGSSNTVTIAVDTGTVATLTDTQVLTNKTLTAPTINGATMTGNVTVDNITLNDNIISSASNADLILDPSGTGAINLTGPTNITGTATVTGQLNVDNLRMDGNTISATTGGMTIDAATGQNITFQKKIIAGEADIGLLQATTVRTDTLQNDTSNGDITISTQGTGVLDFNTATQTTVGAVGAATHLPLDSANEIRPVGYLKIKVAGSDYVIPYFNAS